jgi:hypothetical protein
MFSLKSWRKRQPIPWWVIRGIQIKGKTFRDEFDL